MGLCFRVVIRQLFYQEKYNRTEKIKFDTVKMNKLTCMIGGKYILSEEEVGSGEERRAPVTRGKV